MKYIRSKKTCIDSIYDQLMKTNACNLEKSIDDV